MITDAQVTSPSLNSAEDARAWFDALLDAGVMFHPEDTFALIVDRDGARTFSDEVAERMDRMMDRAYELTGDACEVSIAALAAFEQRRTQPA